MINQRITIITLALNIRCHFLCLLYHHIQYTLHLLSMDTMAQFLSPLPVCIRHFMIHLSKLLLSRIRTLLLGIQANPLLINLHHDPHNPPLPINQSQGNNLLQLRHSLLHQYICLFQFLDLCRLPPLLSALYKLPLHLHLSSVQTQLDPVRSARPTPAASNISRLRNRFLPCRKSKLQQRYRCLRKDLQHLQISSSLLSVVVTGHVVLDQLIRTVIPRQYLQYFTTCLLHLPTLHLIKAAFLSPSYGMYNIVYYIQSCQGPIQALFSSCVSVPTVVIFKKNKANFTPCTEIEENAMI